MIFRIKFLWISKSDQFVNAIREAGNEETEIKRKSKADIESVMEQELVMVKSRPVCHF